MGIVYMLCCKNTGEAYYGSTIRDWKRRLKEHRCKANRCVSKQIIDRGNYEFIILEEVDDEQLHVREKYYVTTFPCINKTSPLPTREERLQQRKQHYQDHKEEALQRKSTPFECECGCVVRWSGKARHFQTKKHLDYIQNK